MDNDDCDLFSIVRSCNTTTFTSPATIFEILTPPQILTTTTINNIISPQSTTSSCYDDFTFIQENNAVSFAPLKPNDFIELNKLMINSNSTTIISNPASTSIPKIITTTISSPTTTTTISPTIPTTHITNNINTSVHASNRNSTFFHFPTLIEQQQMQLNEFTEVENVMLKFNPTTAIHIPTITTLTTPTIITPITTTTTFANPTNTIGTLTATTPTISTANTITTNTSVHETNQYPSVCDFSTLVEQQQIHQSNNNQVFVSKRVACIDITTAHFDRAYSHPSSPQHTKRSNQLPILQTQTSYRILPNTYLQQSNLRSRKRKKNTKMSLVCYMREDELSRDSWAWSKHGQQFIKGSPHPRCYYKCSSFANCPARKYVEKSKTHENAYIVTYKGEHDHHKPEEIKNFVVGTSQNKSSKTILPTAEEAGSSPNVRNLDLPNVVTLEFNHPESSNARVLADKSKIPYSEMELIESQLPTSKDGSSPNVGSFDSYNKMMLKFDEPKTSNAQVFSEESKISYFETEFIGSSNDDDDILIPNITAITEDLLMDFNHLNNGALFP